MRLPLIQRREKILTWTSSPFEIPRDLSEQLLRRVIMKRPWLHCQTSGNVFLLPFANNDVDRTCTHSRYVAAHQATGDSNLLERFPSSLELILKLSIKLIQKVFSKKTVRGNAEGSFQKVTPFEGTRGQAVSSTEINAAPGVAARYMNQLTHRFTKLFAKRKQASGGKKNRIISNLVTFHCQTLSVIAQRGKTLWATVSFVVSLASASKSARPIGGASWVMSGLCRAGRWAFLQTILARIHQKKKKNHHPLPSLTITNELRWLQQWYAQHSWLGCFTKIFATAKCLQKTQRVHLPADA